MKRICAVLCLTGIIHSFTAVAAMADLDPLEDIGPDITTITTRTIGDVTVTISNATGNPYWAATYYDDTVPSFLGAGDQTNAPLNPANVSGTRFISTTEDINLDMPIVFEFSAPVWSFGLTTLDVLEDVETSADAEVRLQGFNGDNLVDEHVRTGIQGSSGLDLDWEVSHMGGITRAVLIRTAGTISAGYGLDDLVVFSLSVPVEHSSWSRVKALYR
jgi:hypothetical protein